MKLRDYQEKTVAAVFEEFKTHDSTLVVLPTGTGKTIVFAEIARRFNEKGRTLIIAHRKELIEQAREKVGLVTGEVPDVEMGEQRADRQSWFKTQTIISSVQTQTAGRNGFRRMHRFDPYDFVLLVVDEAHHAVASIYRAMIDYYRKNSALKILGVTATPDRRDEKALGQIFTSVAYEYEILDAIKDGWLVEIEQEFENCFSLDFSDCRTTAGDLNGRDLARVMEYERSLQQVTKPTLEIVGDRKTLVFAASVKHAERMAEIFNRSKPNCAAMVCGKTPTEEREATMRSYRNGDIQFLVNVGIATEGFDVDTIEVIVQARPTKSRSLYTQMIGRATRPLSGILEGLETPEERREAIAASAKPSMLVLDFIGNSGRHKLISAVDILGGKFNDEIPKLAEKEIREFDGRFNVRSAIELAQLKQVKLRKEEEAKKRSGIRCSVRYKRVKVNPFDVFDTEPQRQPGWVGKGDATDPQRNYLMKCGLEPGDDLTKREASQMIELIVERQKKGLCSIRQARLLKRYKYDVKTMTFKRASTLMSALKRNNWKPLKGVVQASNPLNRINTPWE